jgi:hypothetical protein
MITWILIVGIIILVIGIFFSILGGVEKFHLYRTSEIWLALFIIGLIMVVFGIGIIFFAFFFDRKKLVSFNSLNAEKYWVVNVQWPFGLLNMMKPQEPQVIIKEKQSLGRMIDTMPVIVSAPLKKMS